MPKKIVSSRKYNAALHIDGFHSVKTISISFQPRSMFISKIEQFELPIDCKTVRIFAYSSTREQSNKRSLAPRLTDFFTDFEKKTDCFAV